MSWRLVNFSLLHSDDDNDCVEVDVLYDSEHKEYISNEHEITESSDSSSGKDFPRLHKRTKTSGWKGKRHRRPPPPPPLFPHS